MVGKVEAIVEIAIERPRLDMKLVRSEPRIPCAFDGHIRHLVQAEVVRVVEEASAGTGQVDQEVWVQHALRADRGRTDKRDIAADKGRCGIFGRECELEFRSKILPDANAGLPGCDKAGHRFKIDHAGRIDAARINTDLARSIERP